MEPVIVHFPICTNNYIQILKKPFSPFSTSFRNKMAKNFYGSSINYRVVHFASALKLDEK